MKIKKDDEIQDLHNEIQEQDEYLLKAHDQLDNQMNEQLNEIEEKNKIIRR